MLDNRQLDDADIRRETRNLFYRCNILTRRFGSCSPAVKQMLFRSFSLCFYDVALWNSFTLCAFNKLKSSYNKCIKIFFRCSKYYSVTAMLHELNMADLDTELVKCTFQHNPGDKKR